MNGFLLVVLGVAHRCFQKTDQFEKDNKIIELGLEKKFNRVGIGAK